MANPLNNNELSFYLDFRNDGAIGEIPITEAVKYDGATYIVEQDKDRYGRDIAFMNESIDLFFYKGFYDVTENPLMLPNGVIVFNLTMGFEQLLQSRGVDGFESDIIFLSRKNGIDFIYGNLDFELSETDEETFISCKVIQNVEKQIIKRHDDTTIDVFSDEDIDGNYIEPLQTTNFLQKALPVTEVSEWIGTQPTVSEARTSVFNNSIDTYKTATNNAQQILSSGINGTLSFLSTEVFVNTSDTPNLESFVFLEAQNELSDLTINISDISATATETIFNTFDDKVLSGNGYVKLIARIGEAIDDYDEQIILWQQDFSYTQPLTPIPLVQTDVVNVPTDFSFNIPLLTTGKRVYIYFVCYSDADIDHGTGITVVSYSIRLNLSKMSIKAVATETAINTVIQGVRYIDLFKQVCKSIGGFNVVAPRFDVGGEFYDQFAFSGNLIKNRNDLPFNNTFKWLVDSLQEFNCDYQIISGTIYIGSYADFYPNKEIGVFLTRPDESSILTFNSRFTLNKLEFKYSNYEQEDDQENTTQTTHTDSEWTFPNKQVENELKIDLKQVRDPYKIKKTVDEAIKTTTATENDEKIFLVDVVTLAPNSQATFTKVLSHNINADGNLQLLNDSSFSWAVLGLSVGGNLTLTNTGNIGTREILEITDNIIVLQGGSFSGLDVITSVSYYYDNVLYTNRTNEGFTLINGLDAPDKFSNLRYTIKRNLKHWYSYFATVGRFALNKTFRNTKFINNGELETKYGTETLSTIENANVDVVDFGTPILTSNIYNLKLPANYDEVVSTLNAMNIINSDNTIGGFIRTISQSGKVLRLYPQKLEYEPANENLSITGEQKHDNEFLEVYTENGNIIINDVSYDLLTDTYDWYEINGDYLTLFDNNNMPLVNPTRYDLVSINGQFSNNPIELSEKLINIT